MAFGKTIAIEGEPKVQLAAIRPASLADLPLGDIPSAGSGLYSPITAHLRPGTIAALCQLVERGAESGFYQKMSSAEDWRVWGIFAEESSCDNGRLIGFTGVTNVQSTHDTGVTGQSLTYILNERYLGRGIGRRIAPAVTRTLMREHRFTTVTAQIARDNVASRKVHEGVGFVDIGYALGVSGDAPDPGHRELIQINPAYADAGIEAAAAHVRKLGEQPPDEAGLRAGIGIVQAILDQAPRATVAGPAGY